MGSKCRVCELQTRSLSRLQRLSLRCSASCIRVAETDSMPDIAKSDISPNLDRDKMFNELWWLNYCFCEGVGIGAVGNPFFGGEAVNICLQSRCPLALSLCMHCCMRVVPQTTILDSRQRGA